MCRLNITTSCPCDQFRIKSLRICRSVPISEGRGKSRHCPRMAARHSQCGLANGDGFLKAAVYVQTNVKTPTCIKRIRIEFDSVLQDGECLGISGVKDAGETECSIGISRQWIRFHCQLGLGYSLLKPANRYLEVDHSIPATCLGVARIQFQRAKKLSFGRGLIPDVH